MTHWKSMTDRTYVGAWCVPEDKTVEITKVEAVKLEGIPSEGIKASKRPVLSFKGTPLKLIAGATVCKTITSLYGPDVSKWVGKKITLYATTTKSKGGTMVDCVRVRPAIPTGEINNPVDVEPPPEMRQKQIEGARES